MPKVYKNPEILEDGVFFLQCRGLKLETDYKALVNDGSFIFLIFPRETWIDIRIYLHADRNGVYLFINFFIFLLINLFICLFIY